MSNGKLVKAATLALGCVFGLVGCGTYHHQASAKRDSNSQFAKAPAVQPRQVAQLEPVVSQPEVVKQLVSSTYHFKFDNSALTSDAKSELEQFAQYLSQNPSTKVHVEGYADARGKSEYNLGLGMRRAESVAQYLKQQGVGDSQIETRSFGADKLADMSESQEAHARNRRAVVYFEVESDFA